MAHVLTPTAGYPLVSATVPDDGDDANAASVDVGFQSHENSIATLAARLGGATSGGNEWTYPTPRARKIYLPLMKARPGLYYVDDASDIATLITATQAQTAGWRPKAIVTTNAHPPRDTVAEQFTLRCGLTYQNCTLDLDLISGAVVTQIDCKIVMGVAEADASRRVIAHLYMRNNVTDAITDLGVASASGSAGEQTISIMPTPFTMDSSNAFTYHVVLRSGASGVDGPVDDEWLSCAIYTTEPGPRRG